MKIILFFLIMLVLIFIISYNIYTYRKISKFSKKRITNEAILSAQLVSWYKNYKPSGRINSIDDLFSPEKMQNTGLDMSPKDIIVHSYTQNVPWYIIK